MHPLLFHKRIILLPQREAVLPMSSTELQKGCNQNKLNIIVRFIPRFALVSSFPGCHLYKWFYNNTTIAYLIFIKDDINQMFNLQERVKIIFTSSNGILYIEGSGEKKDLSPARKLKLYTTTLSKSGTFKICQQVSYSWHLY